MSRYWSIRGNVSRAAGRLNDATAAYDRCLHLEPQHRRGLHARARLALERGESGATAHFDRALILGPQDAQLWLGKAQALDAAGMQSDARMIVEQLVAQAPQWTDALELLAHLRWAAGERSGFCDHYRDALSARPEEAAIALSWARMLAGAQYPASAAEVLGHAPPQIANQRPVRLAEAVYAGEAGDDRRATAIFAALAPKTPDELVQFARHQLRIGAVIEAERNLAVVVDQYPGHIAGWALRDIAWRLMDDERHAWLHGRPDLISFQPLALSPEALADLIELLDTLHDGSAPPIGQSVREGTQTRGGLLDRGELALVPLRQALDTAVDAYRNVLPTGDPAHPLLKERHRQWRVARSWSIRLFAAGWHAEHIHPQGLVSSAAYLVTPPADPDGLDAGALELGRPPADLRIDLPPIVTLRPRPGFVALFPSTLYHGTRRFAEGKRMSVAVDVVAD